uniref:Regulator of chromosome condensation protein n=1 Tax=Pithovirus LCPAC202 TaxID=2506592 RepID=A0A481Z647_9VIRU|nr:MAG: regulator of chromosome condensation protein [Pithovirus LCPAC202]
MDGSNFDLLPPEMKTKVLLKLNLKDLLNFCSTSKSAMEYCKDDKFWKAKYQYDFPSIPSTGTQSWEKQYKSLHLIPQSPICIGMKHYAVIDNQSMLYTGGTRVPYFYSGQRDKLTGKYPMKPVHTFGSENSSAVPVKQKVRSVSCGANFIGAVTEEGRVFFWGEDIWGIFTDQDYKTTDFANMTSREFKISEPREFKIPGKAVKIACGPKRIEVSPSMFAVILEDRSVFLRMDFIYYHPELDDFTTKIISTVLNIKALDISAGGEALAIVSTDGKLYFLGRDLMVFDTKYGYETPPIGLIYKDGQIVIEPVHIPLPEKIKQVSLDYEHGCALSVNGNAYLWSSVSHPIKLPFHIPISFITCQMNATSVIDENGKLYIWGNDNLRILYSKDGMLLKGLVRDAGRDDTGPQYWDLEIDKPVQIKFGSLDEYGTGIVAIPEDRVNYVAMGSRMIIATTADDWINIVKPDIRGANISNLDG